MAIPLPTSEDLIHLALRPVQRDLETTYGGAWKLTVWAVHDWHGSALTITVEWWPTGFERHPISLDEALRFGFQELHTEGALTHVAQKVHAAAETLIPEPQRRDAEFCEAMLDLVYGGAR